MRQQQQVIFWKVYSTFVKTCKLYLGRIAIIFDELMENLICSSTPATMEAGGFIGKFRQL